MKYIFFSQTSACEKSGSFFRALVIVFVGIFFVSFYLSPAVDALTLEEQFKVMEDNKKDTVKKTVEKDKKRSAGKNGDIFSKDSEFYGKRIELRPVDLNPNKKDPRLACLLSLVIPGGGQMYLRKDLKGIGFCVATAAGYSATGYYMYDSFFKADEDTDLKTRLIVPGIFLLVSVIIHVVGVVEAYADAEEMNREQNNYSSNTNNSSRWYDNPYVAKIIVEK